ncbi:MAG: valyl-tRNA synthetase, partial [Thermodesulfobacteriota bacterium]|nr:valyl-tRNA synthetase [Thermodesulfobacteriota bacterium]
IEKKWYDFWVEKKFFQAGEVKTGKEYSIVIPPPNVTGSLHMGHALNNTLQDILVRFHRMDGFNTLWMPGMDHAGIATQNVVERQLAQEGLHREDVGRDKFIERVWEWKEESGGTIINQLKRLGCSCDWDRERFTMDEGLSKAVREVFVRLYEEGLIYKGDYIVNWCPRCHTALSDLEVEHEDSSGHLWFIRYPVDGTDRHLTVATTRPETMLGDTAVAVNPLDSRYKDLIGKYAILPLVGRKLVIIGDPIVDVNFGTGALKVTPSHDATDFELSIRHNLDRVAVMDFQGRINDNGIHFCGMDRYECRKAVVKELEQEGFLEKIEPYAVGLGKCYRCKEVVEPLISKQWFVKVAPLAQEALKAVQEGRTTIVPDQWTKTYYEWMTNIRDWCVSRQIWWGHRIPAWICETCGEVIVSRVVPSQCPACNGSKLNQETDVLDTWFSSALWPFSTMGWPQPTELLRTFYPTSCLVTGFDILFFWVARMMMMGLKFMDDVPFRHVYIHALVRDEHGKKMSKSLGNVIDPLLIMDKHGADAFRFTLAALAAQGRDIRLSESRIEGYRNFMNKLWNAARFALPHLDSDGSESYTRLPDNLGLMERWIVSRLHRTIEDVRSALETFRFNDAAQTLYQFTWHEFCDWYIEEAKISLSDSESPDAARARIVLRYVLDHILHLLHPFIPFITEEIAGKISPERESITFGPFPEADKTYVDDVTENQVELLMQIITAIRNIRAEMNISPGKPLTAVAICSSDDEETIVSGARKVIETLARLESLLIARSEKDVDVPRLRATAVVKNIQVMVPLVGIVDPDAEITRLEKEIAKVEKDFVAVQAKLANPNFLGKAGVEAIEKQQTRERDLSAKLAGLQDGLRKMQALGN